MKCPNEFTSNTTFFNKNRSNMIKEEAGANSANSWTRVCDTCRSSVCSVYCRADSAYLCNRCDARIHEASHVASRHERLYICQACERAPAAFLCKADAALLCTTCDAAVHSANPLAHKHHRVPITETIESLSRVEEYIRGGDENENEVASWFNGDDDEYLNFIEDNSCGDGVNQFSNQHKCEQEKKGYGGDSVVPVQCESKDIGLQTQLLNFRLGFEYEPSRVYDFSDSIAHTVPRVPEESTIMETSSSYSRSSKGTIDLFSATPIQVPQQLTPMDREARVLRYREKKKTRKFEKTIRYASRKAYAETRARVKGRFVKRTKVENDVDKMMFSASFMNESGYGIVPSF